MLLLHAAPLSCTIIMQAATLPFAYCHLAYIDSVCCLRQVCGNGRAAAELRAWLQEWRPRRARATGKAAFIGSDSDGEWCQVLTRPNNNNNNNWQTPIQELSARPAHGTMRPDHVASSRKHKANAQQMGWLHMSPFYAPLLLMP